MIRVIGINVMRKGHLEAGTVLHLRVKQIEEVASGKWDMEVEDVTPLPGAFPTSYACEMCGIVERAKSDGSPPEGWTERKFAEGSCFVCDHEGCQEGKVCRICGCTEAFPCKTEAGPYAGHHGVS